MECDVTLKSIINIIMITMITLHILNTPHKLVNDVYLFILKSIKGMDVNKYTNISKDGA